ncbi:rhodanese-like domain-containing protein [Deinococcus humi]|uniref:Rhodanese-related sulfurtransferase n=1 Tax=Deinococcus humi TaxID=662880 RepID=A0A7W8NDK0_9DEIO|nr:hypothetical protein [Deinococcus humi]MBB5362461.1 rhodanese-related sulfurtransferase [Deinococcus humi]GGO28723.1 hypothetical protein GCM10008949_21530 [Deinococcus humi]
MKRLAPEDTPALQEKADALVTVKVRRPGESGAGHLEGAVHTPSAEWRRLMERPFGGPVVASLDHLSASRGRQAATRFAALGANASVRAGKRPTWPRGEGAR